MKTKNYQIKWRYARNITFCAIYTDATPIGVGEAGCYYKDNFCRDTGRKVSLAKALKDAEIPKEERKEIWETYRSMKKGGRW